MLKITSLITATMLLSSCSSTVEELYQKVLPKPSVVTVEDGTQGAEENIIAPDSSSFKSQNYKGTYDRSSSKQSLVQIAEENFRASGVKFVLYFAYDGSEIDESATQEIIKHANFMRDNPTLKLRLEGHADERGTREYNLALGENRALAVKEVLGLYGHGSRIEVISFGEESPISQKHEESAWQKNRRVEFIYK